jgi:uncharacterized protein (DUF927 family)
LNMPGEVVALKPAAERIAGEETKRKRLMLEWANNIADGVIKAALGDAALHFLDDVDDEEHVSLDLKGEFDPIVDEKTGARLSDTIEEFSEKIQQPEKMLRRHYMSALKKKWNERKQKIPTDLEGEHYGRNYLVNRHGVWTRLGAGGLDDLYVWRRIARTRIDPVALSRDTSPQRNWRRRYRITDETGQFAVEIDSELLGKRADRAINVLVRHGVHAVETDEARRRFATFLRYKPRARVIRAPRVGWFEVKKGSWVFVLPTETLGDTAKLKTVLDDPERRGFHTSGTSERWREQVAAPLANNSNVVHAVGCFLAAPLLRWSDEPGGGFHFHGPAKVGKTLIGAIGQSVWGKPYVPGAGTDAFGFTWESTTNRIGQRAVLRSDTGLFLDEIGIGDPKAVALTVYKLAAGLDKGRFGQAERDFNILFVSTGELSLREFLPHARQGQLIRMVDVPAVVRPESAFETISKDEIAAAGRRFYAATNEFHGTVGHDWLQYLVALGPSRIKAELKHLHEAWLALPQVMQTVGRAHPQIVSVVNRFALIAAALTMASTAGIVPWTVGDVNAAAIACMERWLNQRGNIDTAGELLREIRQRRQMIAATIDDRFIRLNLRGRRFVPASAADQRKLESEQEFDGYIKASGEDCHILVWPKTWQRWWVGLDASAVKKFLRREELLIPDRNGEAPSVEKYESSAGAARFYVLAEAFVKTS